MYNHKKIKNNSKRINLKILNQLQDYIKYTKENFYQIS